jgi:hypothetical protein
MRFLCVAWGTTFTGRGQDNAFSESCLPTLHAANATSRQHRRKWQHSWTCGVSVCWVRINGQCFGSPDKWTSGGRTSRSCPHRCGRLSNRRRPCKRNGVDHSVSLLWLVATFRSSPRLQLLKALFCFRYDETEIGVRANGRLYRALTPWRSRLTFLQVRR